MIIEQFLTLPPEIHFQGITFRLRLIIRATGEAALVYGIGSVSKQSKHYKRYLPHGCWNNIYLYGRDYNCDFLYMVENISTDLQLINGIEQVKAFLETHRFIVEQNNKPSA